MYRKVKISSPGCRWQTDSLLSKHLDCARRLKQTRSEYLRTGSKRAIFGTLMPGLLKAVVRALLTM